MKNISFSFLLIATTLCAFSADVKVDATGAIAGSTTTIQAAVTAASNGDRIVVFSNGKIYYENVSIDKSLTFLCAAEQEYFFLNGNITITPANGREITIVGLHQTGNISSASANPVGARCAVNVVDSKIYGTITFNHDGFDMNLLYNQVSKTVELRHGKVIANKMGVENSDNIPNGELKITAENASYGSGDTVFIIANRIYKGDVSINYPTLSFDNANARYFIANNSIRNGRNGSGYYFTSVRIVSCLLTDSANVFINNFVNGYESNLGCSASNVYAAVELKGVKTDNLVNNIIQNRYNSYYGCALFGMRGDYNYAHGYRLYPATGGLLDNNIHNNFSPAPDITFDYETGKVTGGKDGINGGKPGVAYMDVDLTQSDLGTYGGPYTQENYWDTTSPQGGRARVFLLDMPSNIYSLTSPVTIKASSTHMK